MIRSQIIVLCVAICIVLTQATWIFLDARKRKEKYYFLWGLYGMINCPSSLIVYLVVTRIFAKKKNSKD